MVTKTIDVDHTPSHSDSELNNFANIEDEFEDHGSRRCYKKLLIEEKVVYDTVDTCNHSYDKVMIYIFWFFLFLNTNTYEGNENFLMEKIVQPKV